jgi:peptidoglycan/LPS O-acetylase OafA/YrhL
MTAAPASSSRLTELDWVRIAAFGLLIAYHLGMFYVPWDWHVKSPRPQAWLEEPMRLLNPWRMSLLFVVSGAATALLAGGGGAAGSTLAARSRRLLLPLLLGMAVIVPPQAYLEVVEKVDYRGSYLDFMRLYATAYGGFCRGSDCLVLPTWNHLWFLPYLWLYTMLALACAGGRWAAWRGWAALGRGARLLWAPWLVFALWRVLLAPHFPFTHNLVWDWYGHALYASMFVLGMALFGSRDDRHGAWAAAVRLRWAALLAALAGHVVLRWGLPALGVTSTETLPEPVVAALRSLSALRQWAPIVAVLGFARVHLAGRDGPARRWLTEAVFPFYIVHQTAIVIAAHLLARRGWPLGLEALAVVVATLAACAVTFAIARRIEPLRPWFGLARRDPAPRHRASGAQGELRA